MTVTTDYRSLRGNSNCIPPNVPTERNLIPDLLFIRGATREGSSPVFRMQPEFQLADA